MPVVGDNVCARLWLEQRCSLPVGANVVLVTVKGRLPTCSPSSQDTRTCTRPATETLEEGRAWQLLHQVVPTVQLG